MEALKFDYTKKHLSIAKASGYVWTKSETKPKIIDNQSIDIELNLNIQEAVIFDCNELRSYHISDIGTGMLNVQTYQLEEQDIKATNIKSYQAITVLGKYELDFVEDWQDELGQLKFKANVFVGLKK